MRNTRAAWVVCLAAACGGNSSQSNWPIQLGAPLKGEQVVFGPFEVPAPSPPSSTGEVQLCRTMKLSNTEPVAVNRLQVKLAPGSHHFILFRSKVDFPDQVFPCWGTINFDDWESLQDVNRAGGNDWVLTDGEAFIMQPHQQIMIQSHFVNATTVQAPLGGMAILNLYEAPAATAVHELFGKFTVDTNINIPPHSAYTTSRTCTFSSSVVLAAMTGHFHARGTEFKVEQTYEGAVTNTAGTIYDSFSWDSPLFSVFDTTAWWTSMNALENGLKFTCSYFNNTDSPIGWGGHADVQEHCNLFFQYYYVDPKDAVNQPLSCIEGSGGW